MFFVAAYRGDPKQPAEMRFQRRFRMPELYPPFRRGSFWTCDLFEAHKYRDLKKAQTVAGRIHAPKGFDGVQVLCVDTIEEEMERVGPAWGDRAPSV